MLPSPCPEIFVLLSKWQLLSCVSRILFPIASLSVLIFHVSISVIWLLPSGIHGMSTHSFIHLQFALYAFNYGTLKTYPEVESMVFITQL